MNSSSIKEEQVHSFGSPPPYSPGIVEPPDKIVKPPKEEGDGPELPAEAVNKASQGCDYP